MFGLKLNTLGRAVRDTFRDKYLLSRFDGAAAAYSLRDLRGTDPTVVRVRRSLDSAEADFSVSEVSDGTLEEWVNFGNAYPADYGAGAAAAYSLRQVSASYTGPVIRVRRSVDSAEANFTALEVSDGTLEDWVGASNDGFVTTWYDQSGNENNATQATATNQPKVVSSGSLIVENGKAAVEFDNVDDYIETTSTINVSNSSYFIVAQMNASTNANDYSYLFVNSDVAKQSLAKYAQGDNTDKFYVYDGSSIHIDGLHSLSQEVISLFFPLTSPYINMYVDGSARSFSSNPVGALTFNNKITIGKFKSSNTHFFDGHLQEFILYNSDQSTNRTKIESNINYHYGIYTNTNNGHVTTWYDQSGNANHATQATVASQPKIVDAGTLVTENGKPAIDFDGVNDFLEGSSNIVDSGSPRSIFTAAKRKSNKAIAIVFRKSNLVFSYTLGDLNSGLYYYYSDGIALTRNWATVSNPGLNFSLYNLNWAGAGNQLEIRKDTDLLSRNTGSVEPSFENGTNGFTIGSRITVNSYGSQVIGEIIIYPSDQSSNRSGIESNINNHYNIWS